MTYDYFYGQQAEMFAFYRVPKVLFTEDCFWNVSTDAKLLYGILLDRMNLSARNGWLDEGGRVYIIFTIEEIKGALGCAEKKAVKLLDELEKKCGLIERKRQGLGKPNLIYVKNFISGSVERQFLNCQKDNSGVVKNTIQELSKAQGNNTDTNYIDFSDTDPFFPSGFCGKEADGTDEFTRYYQYFYEQLSMDYLKQDYPYDHEILDLILHLIVEVMCSNTHEMTVHCSGILPSYMAVQERENCCHPGSFACICGSLMKQAGQILRLALQGTRHILWNEAAHGRLLPTAVQSQTDHQLLYVQRN